MRDKNGLELVDMCSEDVAFCKNIEDAGFDIMLNTRLHVGHESRVIFWVYGTSAGIVLYLYK